MKKVKVVLELLVNEYDVNVNDKIEEEICNWFDFVEFGDDIDCELEDVKFYKEWVIVFLYWCEWFNS